MRFPACNRCRERNYFTSYSRNRWEVIFPAPVLPLKGSDDVASVSASAGACVRSIVSLPTDHFADFDGGVIGLEPVATTLSARLRGFPPPAPIPKLCSFSRWFSIHPCLAADKTNVFWQPSETSSGRLPSVAGGIVCSSVERASRASKAAGELPSTLLTETPIHTADVEILGVAKEVDSRLRVFCMEGKLEVLARVGANCSKP